MNGQPTINHPTNHNEQLVGKFHVVNVDKIPTNTVNNHDETAINAAPGQQLPPVSTSSTTDESACASRFQMIRVDRNFGRGRWKVNDYEPPENIATSTNPPVNTIENEPINITNSTTLSTIPTTSAITTVPANLLNDSNATSSAALAAAAASVAAATAFQQQQQRLAMNNAATMVPTANVPPPAGLLHPYPPAALANMTAPNQSYILQNHPQFGYYPYFPPHYSPYAAQWAALAAANPYLTPPIPPSQLPTGNLGDPIRLTDGVLDGTNENPMISSNPFSNNPNDHLQNAQLAAAASFIYAAHHHHPTYVSQPPPTTASPYTTIPAYHPAPPLPTIIPPPTQSLSLAQIIPNNTTDIQQQFHQAPILTSPKHEASTTKNPIQQATVPRTTPNTTTASAKPQTAISNGVNTDTLKTTNPTHITDLLSSSPSIPNSQQPPPSLLSPITIQASNPNKVPTSSLNDIWPYTATGSPLNLSQTAAVTEMNLLNNENSQGTEITHEILKELTTPTKQNISTFSLSERRARLRYRRQRSTTDIDNKISAAMDLVKMHLLSAVREEVTELRQQIRTLNEKVNNVEHENAFLRQHVTSEIYAQYTPLSVVSSAANDPINPSTNVMTTASTVPSLSITSSQPIPMTSLSSLPLSLAQQPSTLTISQTVSAAPPVPSSSTNLPPI